MSAYSIAVYDASGAAVMVPASLDVQPERWAAVARGGMWDAEIAVFGPRDGLMGLTAWLGYRLEIVNGNGAAVWWGDVAAVEIVADGVRRGATLERLANRIMLRYAQTQPGGGAASADTDWLDDTISQGRFGVRELRISPGREMTAAGATAYRATALNTLKEPFYTLAPDDGETQARIYCTGYWQRGKWRYYSQPAGLVEHAPSGEPFPLGLGFTSSRVAFVTRNDAIHDMDGNLAHFTEGMVVKVSGAAQAGNNAAWTISSGGDDRAPVVYVSNNVTFSANDDILDANSGLGFIVNDDAFTIAGASNAIHNGTQLMDKAGATAVEINNTYRGGNFTSESGATITFRRGNAVKVTGNLTNEQAGNSVTVTAWGQRYYQTFGLPTAGSWTAAAVEVRLRRVGGPGDSITVQLVANNAGVPGSVLDSATVAAANIPTESGWVTFTLANTAMLDYGTVYGIVVLRTGSNDAANYYEIDVDADATYAGGSVRQYDGSTWQTPNPLFDIVFRVLGGLDTGAQIGAALLANGAPDVDAVTSGITSNQYRAGELRVTDEVDALLDTGDSLGNRLLLRVHRNLAASVYTKGNPQAARWTYAGNRLYDLYGQAAEDGYLPAGEWVHLGAAGGLGPWAALSPVFVERAEWRAGGGLTLEPEGGEDVYSTGAVQG